jgi:hypothetical protein
MTLHDATMTLKKRNNINFMTLHDASDATCPILPLSQAQNINAFLWGKERRKRKRERKEGYIK